VTLFLNENGWLSEVKKMANQGVNKDFAQTEPQFSKRILVTSGIRPVT